MTIQNHLVQQTQLDKQDTNLPASSSSSRVSSDRGILTPL